MNNRSSYINRLCSFKQIIKRTFFLKKTTSITLRNLLQSPKSALFLFILFSPFLTSASATPYINDGPQIINILPRISQVGETVTFRGVDGTNLGRSSKDYRPWSSSIDELLSNNARLNTSNVFNTDYPDDNRFFWYSSIDGLLSTDAQFNTSNLSEGTHTISFRVFVRGPYNRHYDRRTSYYEEKINGKYLLALSSLPVITLCSTRGLNLTTKAIGF